MKYLFVVQGEGRGHLTQAIVLSNLLRKNGHEVAGILVGKNKDVNLPAYFIEKTACKVETFDSPHLLPVEKNVKVSLLKSVINTFKKSPRFLNSYKFLDKKIEEYEPDVVINFYELIISLLFEIKKPKTMFVCIGHQYFFLHPHFRFPKPRRPEIAAFLYYSRLTCRRADKILALSLGSPPRYNSGKINIVPPLVREEVFALETRNEDFIAGYIVNPAFEDQIVEWHHTHPAEKLHFFGDRNQSASTEIIDATLSFSKVNDRHFLEVLSSCKAYASTAGFESVCEAMYLGKPVMMVPSHIEQYCNMIDAERAGAGIGNTGFDLSVLQNYIPQYHPSPEFRKWVESAEKRILEQLT